ncbi:MAG TPA: hypothetical protein VEO00_05980 [Actinomycetota bacterium]|nr:hypothetical protein [Actinomycetota bacterium]
MDCRAVRPALSARMDGVARGLDPAAEAHLAACAGCRAFDAAAWRLREAVRFQVAEPVPDLVEAIMDRVRTLPDRPRPLRLTPRRRDRPRNLTPVRSLVAAALAGALAGALVVGAGLAPRPSPAALATEIPGLIAAAATGVDEYAATFRIEERNWRPEVPARTFDVDVAFAAPERLRVRVADRTAYPAGPWPRNDSLLVVVGSRWELTGPEACTAEAAPACGRTPDVRRAVTGRAPFDADAPMPTDIVLPVTTLAGSERVTVLGEGRAAGRDAVRVELAAADGGPLFAFFQEAGSWRPQYPADRVTLWLDRETWLPLRFTVAAVASPDRDAWAAANGIPREPAGSIVLQARAVRLSLGPVDRKRFAVSGGTGRDQGFRALGPVGLARALGADPIQPADTGSLRPLRAGRFAGRHGEVLLSYGDGLARMTVAETRTHRGPSFFGNVGPLAERVRLPGGGVAYYEPAVGTAGRRLAVHAAGWDLFLESNLPRAELLAVAGSLPVRGVAVPASWDVRTGPGGLRVERVGLSEAARRAGFPVLVPSPAPDGFELASVDLVELSTGRGVTLYYRRAGAEPGGYALRLHQARGEDLPPASGTDQVAVRVAGALGRWSPGRHELEWVGGGIYRSLAAPGLELERILAVAGSLAEVAR